MERSCRKTREDKEKMTKCHDCGVEEGQLHKYGCDMERCPKCRGQLISCNCLDSDIAGLPRIPWVEVPVLCALCGAVFPDLFLVPDNEWRRYVPPNIQQEVLCRPCYDRLRKLFPAGWIKCEGTSTTKS